MGGGFNLFALKAMALVNFTLLSLIVTITLINCYYVIIVNMFSVIKHGRSNGLGESVMHGKDGLLSL